MPDSKVFDPGYQQMLGISSSGDSGEDSRILNMLLHVPQEAENDSASGTSLATRHNASTSSVYSVNMTSSVWIIAYQNSSQYPCLRVVTRSAGAVSAGAEYVLESAAGQIKGLFRHPTDNTKVVCFFDDHAIVATFSGTSFSSKGTKVTGTYTPDFVCKESDANTYWQININSGTLEYEKWTISADTITSGGASTFATGGTGVKLAGILSSDRGFWIGESGDTVTCQIFSISGTTFSHTSMPSDTWDDQGASGTQVVNKYTNKQSYWTTVFDNSDAHICAVSQVNYTGSERAHHLTSFYYDKTAESLDSVMPYDTATNNWTYLRDMQPGGMLGPCDASYDNFLINAGP